MFKGRITKDGKGFIFEKHSKIELLKYMKSNPNQPFEISPILAESTKLRGWFEGGLCPLVAFYQENLDHHSSKDVKIAREWLKMEFNSEIVALGDKVHRVAKSTKNELNMGFVERVLGYIIENFAPPQEAIDPKAYKHWKNALYMHGGPDNYIDYLLEIKILNNMRDKEGEVPLHSKEEQREIDGQDGIPVDDYEDRQPNYALTDEEE